MDSLGVNFTAMFGYSEKTFEDMYELHERLREQFPIHLFVNKDHNEEDWNWVGSLQDLKHDYMFDSALTLDGPYGLKIVVGKHLCELWHVSRWHHFQFELETRIFLRRVCLHLSDFFGTPLYIPEIHDCVGYLFDGCTMEQLKSDLFDKFGPAQHVNLIEQTSLHDYNHYFYDDFKDVAYFTADSC
ncbi:hypothetical protein [Marinicrinis sediminis]|uniref:Uncharacterized protein n=1 Tax=Marinicrinis sediminis TaxID=1652465 RepID=A0ABW5R6G9_9BACL